MKELTLVADHGRFLMPFARILLAFDDLRHKNTAAARKRLEWLREHFPITRCLCRKLPNWTTLPSAPDKTKPHFRLQ